MIYRTGFDRLIHSRKFWVTVFGVAQTVLFQFVPEFPQAVWVAIDALVGVLIVTLAVDDLTTPPEIKG